MSERPLTPWVVEATETLLDRRWLRLERQRVRAGTGVVLDEFFLIATPPWAGAVVVTTAGEVVLVEQYRHALGGPSLELPAGVVDPGEDPLLAARREVLEETGFEAATWEPLLAVSPEPSRHTTRAHLFLARGAVRVAEPRPDASEQLRVRVLPGAEALAALDAGRIAHGVHVGALLLAARRGALG